MRLTDLITENKIILNVKATTREDVIRELITYSAAEISDIEAAYSAVMERERIMTTGIGNAIAIPHCKNSACPQFSMVLGVCPTPIEFNAIDNEKVKLIFLLLGPEKEMNLHIKLLSRISRIVSKEEMRTGLLNAQSSAEAFGLISDAEAALPEIEN